MAAGGGAVDRQPERRPSGSTARHGHDRGRPARPPRPSGAQTGAQTGQSQDRTSGRPAGRQRSQPPTVQQRAAGRSEREPVAPQDADLAVLGDDVRAELRGLSPDNADRVGRHLVAAGRLLADDPARALEHARAARRTAGRLAAVREAVGLAAYLSGQWQEALTELRAVRRMTGDSSHLPLLADCERGLGRPDRALALARSAEAGRLPTAARVELRIVEAGARRDLGQVDAALVVLQDAGLDSQQPEQWTIRLWYAYADALLAGGRREEARRWFAMAAAADEDEQTDAAERAADLDG